MLTFAEARAHPHNRARGVHAMAGALARPAPAPRFSRTPSQMAGPPTHDGLAALARFGLADRDLEGLAESGVVAE